MFRSLFAGLTQWTYALREIAESHPAAISASVWSETRRPQPWADTDAPAEEEAYRDQTQRTLVGTGERIHGPAISER